MKNFLWIVDFQYKNNSGIKALSLCIEETNITRALGKANKSIGFYMEMHEDGCPSGEYVITDIGLADEASRKHLGEIFSDPINDPDPELFRKEA